MCAVEKRGAETAERLEVNLPADAYNEDVAFYRDVIGLPILTQDEYCTVFKCDSIDLQLNRAEELELPNAWMSIHGANQGSAQDSSPTIPASKAAEIMEDFDGYWVSDLTGLIKLVKSEA